MIHQLRMHTSTGGDKSSVPHWGTEILHAVPQGQKKKKPAVGVAKSIETAFVYLFFSGVKVL